ncbi:MAG: hypothetical protein NUV98_00610 [Candidatus Roizmanbacteria bacterium]|nr:hypothetical protein [Candidatus Roizmanbacteria bacterium]
MNLPALFSFIPKIAIFLLLIVGGYIIYELTTIFRSKLPKKVKKTTEENPDTMQPLKFPHVSNKLLNKSPVVTKKKLPLKTLTTRMTAVLILAGIGGLAYYLFVLNDPYGLLAPFNLFPDHSNRPDVANQQPTATPTQAIDYGTEMLLYVETEEDAWMPTTQEELSLLSPGDTIKIAIKTTIPPGEIEITVNGKNVPLSVDKSPLGYPYAQYVIPEGESEFRIAARVL